MDHLEFVQRRVGEGPLGGVEAALAVLGESGRASGDGGAGGSRLRPG
jgi:hypothetical protein